MSENLLKSLVQYLRNNLPGYTYYPGHWPAERSRPCILVRELGGPAFFHGVRHHAVYILAEDSSYMDCRDACFAVYDLLRDSKGVNLPAVDTGDSPVRIETIEVAGMPQSLGEDSEGQFHFTIDVIMRR